MLLLLSPPSCNTYMLSEIGVAKEEEKEKELTKH